MTDTKPRPELKRLGCPGCDLGWLDGATRCPACNPPVIEKRTVTPLTPDESAMVEANTGLVGHYLRLTRCPTERWDDAFQDGVVGLVRAVQKFEPERGWKFSTYAMAWIRQAVQRGVQRAAGVNQRTINDFVPPMSLDRENDHGQDLYNLIPDDRVDVDDEVIDGIEASTTLRTAYAACLNDLDRAIVDNFTVAAPLNLAALAAACDVSPDTIRRHRRRLRTLLRRQLAA